MSAFELGWVDICWISSCIPMHSSIKKKWRIFNAIYLIYFSPNKKKHSKTEEKKHKVFKEKNKKNLFFNCSKSFLLVKSFIDVKPRIINSSFEIQTQGNWDRSNAVILVERRPYSTYKDLELSTVAAVTRKESE